ncbi:DUF1688 family protein [Roseibium sp. MMSF_3544]|uniref:DUF1688 family protein n=1 Tax=unclassified Roseibium TaxID=2629323 RepID=UPI00273E1741|nr:DUF1688 family protein [Roseibium sp. MMSF_3544]
MDTSNPNLDLFKPQEVRRRAHDLLGIATDSGLKHVEVDLSKLSDALLMVLETTKENYPEFHIPPYGVWRDFEAGGIDRWAALASARSFEGAEQMLTSAADLAVLSAYMKTMHPVGWHYEDRMTETRVSGKQASALAAFHMFASGSFSSEMTDPYRVDAETLIRMEKDELAFGLQWDLQDDTDLLEALQQHLKRLGEALALRSDFFSEGYFTRPGLLMVRLAREGGGAVSALKLMDRLLEALAPVWLGGAEAGDISLGDSFRHSGGTGSSEATVFPFHLAAQDMVYSLVEPFAWAGLEVEDLNLLAVPADDTHAAVFVKTGVLKIKDGPEAPTEESVRDRMIEIRAITMALTDKLADLLRSELDVTAEQLPLTCILEGGTSRAGNHVLQQSSPGTDKLGRFLNPGAVFWLPFGA